MVENEEKKDDLLVNDDLELEDLFLKPVKKHKILFISDHQLSTSGVGTQARFLIDGLIKTGKYSFKCLGGAIKHQNYQTIGVNEDFIVKPVDGFGTKELIRELLITEKPDAIFLFTDPRQFIWLWEMEDEINQVCPIVYWHVWDNDPYPYFNKAYYEGTDLINCISEKTYSLVKPKFPDKTNYIPHAFPKEVYFPIQGQQLEQLKLENLGAEKKDWFKVLWINRNATRKVPNDVIDCFNRFLDVLQKKHGHKNALMIMHTNPKDTEGPDLLGTVDLYGLQNHVWFSTELLDFQKMNILFNICDTCINISKAEGFGLGTLTMLQLGKPVVALCTGGETSKVLDSRNGFEYGAAIKIIKRQLVGSQLVGQIYEDYAATEDVVDGLMKVYEMSDADKSNLSQKAIEYVNSEFNFTKMVEAWDTTMSKCIESFKAKHFPNTQKEAVGQWTLTEINPSINTEHKPVVVGEPDKDIEDWMNKK